MPAAVIAPIQWLIELFLPILEFLHDSVGLGWGLSIIVLTCMLRLAVLPLGIKGFKSMRALQAVTPQMKALQAKYKDDKPRLQQETMKLYSEHKVNPFGSCLPLLVQIPFLISFYYMLRTDLKFEICGGGRDLNLPHDIGCHQVPNPSTEFTYNPDTFDQVRDAAKNLGGFGEQFLGITDITAVATGGLLALLLVLYVGSQMASSIVNMPPTADKNQKRLMLALPLVFVFFLIPIKPPSGLFIYWITTNVFTLVQQWGLIQVYGHVKHAPVEEEEDDVKVSAGGAAAVRAGGGGGVKPPPPPRKRKKKRSGRRR